MATGGIFQLLINDGNQDKLLMATDLLNNRLKEIERLRCKNPTIKDTTPTLVDIERTHVMFLNAHFKPFVAIGYEYAKIGVQEGIIHFGNQVTFSIPQFGDFFNDMVVHVHLSGLKAGPTSTKARYCEFIGHRLFQRTHFEVNGNDLDTYTDNVYNFHYSFCVPDQKKRSWKQCVGQEVAKDAWLTQNPLGDEYRELKRIVNGAQTPKAQFSANPPTTTDVEMWIPLLFWYNLDPRLSIPSVSIPYGQRFIKIELAPVDLICQGLPTPDFTPPVITLMDLYINNIFVNPEIHDIFIKRVGFSLIRVHREEAIPVSANTGSLLLNQLKYPVETIYVGLKPNINESSMEDWNKYSFITDVPLEYPVAVPNPGIPPPDWVLAFAPAILKEQTPTVDTFAVSTVGIDLWLTTPATFFNQYIPYMYGGFNTSSPEDVGVYMIPFNLYPGAYQPSGHINLSRTREFYLNYTSSVISSIIPGIMYVAAVAINFLLISDGKLLCRQQLDLGSQGSFQYSKLSLTC
jgi:hypothetical protein